MSNHVLRPSRWWSSVPRTETYDVVAPASRPSFDDRVHKMREIKNRIVQHQCEIAKLEENLDDEKRATVEDLRALDLELGFSQRGEPCS